MRHIIPISGKDSAATAIVQKEIDPSLDYEYFYNETGAELPEVNAWLAKMESYLGKPVFRIGADLEEIIYNEGILPSVFARYCTKKAKIYPMEDYLFPRVRGKRGNARKETIQQLVPVSLYLGIRADEVRGGYESHGFPIEPVYPLQQVGITIGDVWTMLEKLDLLPPQFFWQSLYDMVMELVGNKPTVLEKLKPWQKARIFSWRQRTNCYYCFFQARYEFVGLLETYPELFWRAVEMEENVGGDGFYLKKDCSLRYIADHAESIKSKRAKAVARFLTTNVDADLEEEVDFLSVTSCGLLCGK